MQIFDLRETIISFSMLQLTNYFKKMKPGDSIEILFSDESIPEDIKRLLPEKSCSFTRIEKMDPDSSDFRIKLKKIKALSPEPIGGSSCPTSI